MPATLLYDVEADPSETSDLASSLPDVVTRLRARLAFYNKSNTRCCVCTSSGQTEEMKWSLPDGFWGPFYDQSDNPDPNCSLMNEPPWRKEAA